MEPPHLGSRAWSWHLPQAWSVLVLISEAQGTCHFHEDALTFHPVT